MVQGTFLPVEFSYGVDVIKYLFWRTLSLSFGVYIVMNVN